MPLKLGVLGSGKGSNFVALADAVKRGDVPAEIVLVASDFHDAKILDEARARGIKTYACPVSRYRTRLEPEIEQALAQALLDAEVELVVLAGFMRVIKEPLLSAFPQKIINIHPSLLPSFPGLRAWEQAIQAGVTESGCTVHWVNEVIDGGAIIAQAKVSVSADDTAESLHAKIQEQEHLLLPQAVRQLALEWKR